MISQRLDALAAALGRMRGKVPIMAIEVPIQLVNTSNSREGWRAIAKRAKIVREAARMMVATRMMVREAKSERVFPLDVRLVYVGPRELDYDGVWSAVKSLRDGVADALGVDDRDPRVVWVPDQERGGVREYSARVEVYLG